MAQFIAPTSAQNFRAKRSILAKKIEKERVALMRDFFDSQSSPGYSTRHMREKRLVDWETTLARLDQELAVYAEFDMANTRRAG
jgi:hypothetical protein